MSSRRRRTLILGVLLASAWGVGAACAANLHAYYTRLDAGEPFEQYARVGDFADIVVGLPAPEGRLVFWRGSSYLPYWETAKGKWFLEELVPRQGDGSQAQPDRVNAFSRVLLVEDTPRQVTVCWRYLPRFEGGNPYRGAAATNFVEECFVITPKGSLTRTIKQGTAKIDDWNDPLNQTVQTLQLAPEGVRELSRTAPRHSPAPAAVPGSPLQGPPVIPPVREWRFDEGAGDVASETVTGEPGGIPGRKSLWRKGVSGTCLQFDGYNTVLSLPPAKAPAIADALTLEAWIAIGAYPWNWCPIVQQGDDDGYFLGVSSHAEAGFKLKLDSTWHAVVATNQLARFRWYHLAGTYDGRTGLMALFLDGKPLVTKQVGAGRIRTTSDPIRIGRGKPRPWTDPVGRAGEALYAFDGLIDEVRIYDRALSAAQVTAAAALAGTPPPVGMDPRALPAFDTGGRFGAHYTRLKYYDAWDNLWNFGPYPDVVVGFDLLPGQFVFWRGTGYIPMLVNEKDQWYSNEFNETWGRSGGSGCQEPMSDKQSLFNHARVLENTPARVVVQWRFPLVDTRGNVIANYNPATGWGDWSDWYYYIYPDGVAVKTMHLWTDGPRNHEWHESMAILGPNQHPEQVVATDPALTLADLRGKATAYSWTKGPPRGVNYRDQKIHVVNYRAEYDPFTIGDFARGNVYGGGAVPYSVFPSWNHWPVAQIPSDGRYASFPDRAAHCSLTHVYMPDYRARFGARPYQEKLLMEGLSKQGAEELAPLARSWLQAPAMEPLSNCRGSGYDPGQRAYVLSATGEAPSFRVAASPERPIVNPCFVVRNWNSEESGKVSIDSTKQADGPTLRQGTVWDPNGRRSLVVWLQRQATTPVTFTLRGAKPELSTNRGKPAAWAAVPGMATNDVFAIAMSAAALPGIGTEYLFDCCEGPGRGCGWQEDRTFVDAGLPPDSAVAYRVKARDAYFNETAWSPVGRAKTGAPPAPVRWCLDEGAGATIKDSAGGHEGAIRGTAAWVPGVAGKALHLDGKSYAQLDRADDLRANGAFTWAAWMRTTRGGAILARSGPGREWKQGGKVMFVEDGRLKFDVGWVGVTVTDAPVADGQWHHVAVSVSTAREGHNVQCFVDGRLVGGDRMEVARHNEAGLPVRIGFCNDDYPRQQSGFVGDLDEVQWFSRALGPEEIARLHADRGAATK